jgi:Domain of unknown function (DUF4286)
MFLYNITVGVDADIEQVWVQWMKTTHIPDVLKTNLFVDYKFYKVLHDNSDGSISYSVQYFATTLENVVQYLEKFAPVLMEEHRQKFKEKHVAFQTLLEEV